MLQGNITNLTEMQLHQLVSQGVISVNGARGLIGLDPVVSTVTGTASDPTSSGVNYVGPRNSNPNWAYPVITPPLLREPDDLGGIDDEAVSRLYAEVARQLAQQELDLIGLNVKPAAPKLAPSQGADYSKPIRRKIRLED